MRKPLRGWVGHRVPVQALAFAQQPGQQGTWASLALPLHAAVLRGEGLVLCRSTWGKSPLGSAN